MPLDPQAQVIIDRLAASGARESHLTPIADIRSSSEGRRAVLGTQLEAVARVEDRQIAGKAGPIAIRIYTPEGEGPFPVLVYYHGGGWMAGSIDTQDHVSRSLANRAGCIVVSADYRLAPENKFPAATEDVYSALEWAGKNAAGFGGDPSRIAVGGSSAGANLAAVVALMARDRGGPALVGQVLYYPILDFAFDTPSYEENGTGYVLTRADMVWYWQQYLANESDGFHPYASPLRSEDLSGLPSALIIVGEYDPLRDEAGTYAARLEAAGTPATFSCYPGVIHGFVGMADTIDAGKRALDESGAALRAMFSRP